MAALDATQVIPGVWVGSAGATANIPALNITHVLSVLNGAPEDLDVPPAHSLWLDVEDSPTANLLVHLPATNAFMQGALHDGGRVLVRCAQGVSRSVAVVVAYLIKAQGLDVDDALATIRAARPSAQPNPGFVEQLRLFQAMGAALDPGNAQWREFRAYQAALSFRDSGVHRCRKCRALLADSGNALEVETGPGPSAFSWRKREKYAPPATEAEPSVFVEPLGWMAETLRAGETAGKLYCPRCEARVGSYSWAGTQSASGRWVVPAFQLHASKIDTQQVAGPATAAAPSRAMPRLLPRAKAVSPGPGPAATSSPLDRPLSPDVAGPPAQISAWEALATAPLPHFTHLILDCDGVMVDTERPSCESLRLAVKEVTGFDVPHKFPEDYYPVFGMDLRTCLEYYYDTYSEISGQSVSVDTWYPALRECKEALFKELTAESIPAFSGIKELVAVARAAGLGVAIASSGSPEKIAHNLACSGLAGIVPDKLTVSAAYVARGKPSPDVYLEALRRLGCEDASRAMVIEDAVNGCHAARAAGCFVVGVTNTLPRAMLAPAADLVVDHVSQLESVLVPSPMALP